MISEKSLLQFRPSLFYGRIQSARDTHNTVRCCMQVIFIYVFLKCLMLGCG